MMFPFLLLLEPQIRQWGVYVNVRVGFMYIAYTVCENTF